jgi:hypothetical protein
MLSATLSFHRKSINFTPSHAHPFVGGSAKVVRTTPNA